jgi:hypothetical protein
MSHTWDDADESRKHWTPETIDYTFWYVPEFPIDLITRCGDEKKNFKEMPWLVNLLEDVALERKFRNPLVVHDHLQQQLDGKQSRYRVLIGRNRLWCAKRLGWDYVPIVVSTAPGATPAGLFGVTVLPADLLPYFPDNNVRLWNNPANRLWGIHVQTRGNEQYA